MKQKSKFRRFWNLDHRKSDGFTLVELIVVIAILAVLGGASVPAYNLYIKKARESADNQLLAAVNTAFASACVENKVDSADITEATVQVKSQLVTGLATVAHKEATLDKVNMAAAFMRYMLGNESMEFKNENIKSLKWNDEEDCFEMDMTNVAIPEVVFSNGKEATLTQAALNAISESFLGKMNAAELTNLMDVIKDNTTDMMLELAGEKISSLIGDGLYNVVKYILNEEELGALAALQTEGIKTSGVFSETMLSQLSKDLAKTPGLFASKAEREACAATRQAALEKFNNGMLLYAAQNIGNQNPTTVYAAVKKDYFNTDTNIINTGGNGGTAVSAALRESVYQAYLRTDTGKEAYANASGSEAEKKAQLTGNQGFTDYLNSPQCEADIAGLIGSMSTVNNNSGTIGNDKVVTEGMANEDVQTLLGSIYG